MFETSPNTLEQYIYNNTNLYGGYPMTEFIKGENKKTAKMIGGSHNDIGLAKFEGLAIPIGLVSFPHQMCKSFAKMKSNIEVIDDDLFNKMFESIADVKKHKPRGGTRKIRRTIS